MALPVPHSRVPPAFRLLGLMPVPAWAARDDAALPIAASVVVLLRFRTADYAELTVCAPPTAGRLARHLIVHSQLTVTQLRHLQAAFARLSLPAALAPEEIAALIPHILPGVRPVMGE